MMAHKDSTIDPLDPHGAQAGHHGHFIAAWQTQLLVLITLLFFTALTVTIAQSEIWATAILGWDLPRWVNVVGVLSIATVKATLVCMFFMQLKYDKPLNSFVLLFGLACVGLFLALTMLDLGTRGMVTDYKGEYLVSGGTSAELGTAGSEAFSPRLSPHVDIKRNTSIAQYAYELELYGVYNGDEQALWADYYLHHYIDAGKEPHRHPRDSTDALALVLGGDHSGHDDAGAGSDANKSRSRTGTTEGLFEEGGHEDDHSEHGGG